MNYLKKYVLLLLLTFIPANGNIQEQMKGINCFGFETEYAGLMCDWKHDQRWHLEKIKSLGFNYIRLPFSLEFVQNGNWDKIDEFLYLSNELDLNIVLDFHRLNSHHQSFKPFDDVYSFDSFKQGWLDILNRYNHYDNVKGVDIFNEYQGEDFTEWNWIATEIVEFIEYHFENRFFYIIGGVRWGGSSDNVEVNIPYIEEDRIYYSVHKYHFSDAVPREDKWDWSFDMDKIKKIVVGEVGYMSEEWDQVEFFKSFIQYLKKNEIHDTFFWSYSPNSGDTKGILLDDCESVDYSKMDLLHELWENKKRNLKQLSAPGSPASVSGTGFVLNNLIYMN